MRRRDQRRKERTKRDSRERSQGSATHGIHVEIRSELNRICSVPADSANAATMRELYVRARVFPTCISTYLLPDTRCIFSPLLARGLIPRLIAHAEQTIFFFYYSSRIRIVCFVSIKFPARAPPPGRPPSGQKIRRNRNREDPNRIERSNIPKISTDALETLAWTENL